MHSGSRTKKSKDRNDDESRHADPGAGSDAEIEAARNADSPNPRILIVEDVASLREALRMYLEFYGYTVASAGSFDDALESASKRPPDVAVCDRQLGEERDGIDVARALQRLHGAQLVFVSATSMSELRAQTTDLDVTAYLKKPVLPRRIAAAVRLATGNQGVRS
ncbi:MAG: response regulator [Woeseia sp.]|nr:response regulator [Woeseia sp.]NNE62151.1 response regulator [Woeseia sp.]